MSRGCASAAKPPRNACSRWRTSAPPRRFGGHPRSNDTPGRHNRHWLPRSLLRLRHSDHQQIPRALRKRIPTFHGFLKIECALQRVILSRSGAHSKTHVAPRVKIRGAIFRASKTIVHSGSISSAPSRASTSSMALTENPDARASPSCLYKSTSSPPRCTTRRPILRPPFHQIARSPFERPRAACVVSPRPDRESGKRC